MTYIEMNINQRINYKANIENKANAYGNLDFNNKIIVYKTAYECTGYNALFVNQIKTYSRNSRKHFH